MTYKNKSGEEKAFKNVCMKRNPHSHNSPKFQKLMDLMPTIIKLVEVVGIPNSIQELGYHWESPPKHARGRTSL